MKIISPFAALLAAFALTLSPASVSLAYTMPNFCDGGVEGGEDSEGDSELIIADCDGDTCDGELAVGYTIEEDTEEEEERLTFDDSSDEEEGELLLDDTTEEEEEQYILDDGGDDSDDDSDDESFVIDDEEEEEGEV